MWITQKVENIKNRAPK